MSDAAEQTGAVLTFRRPKDGKDVTSKGDVRCILDTNNGPVASFGKNSRNMFVPIDINGTTVNIPLRRNVYVPNGGDVDGVTVRITVEKIHNRSASSAPEGSPYAAMLAAGDVAGLAAWYVANVPGIGEKRAPKVAEKAIAQHRKA